VTRQELGDTVSAIKQLLDGLSSRPELEWTNRAWTRAIKDDIGRLGKTKDWLVCASGFCDQFEREWLYDLVWYREDSRRRLSEVGLVLESEWIIDPLGIKYDFEKLLVAKAPLKVMICQSKGSAGASASTTLTSLEDSINAFHAGVATEVYLLAVFDHSKNAFDYREIPGDKR
jgi:hypothetical protein